MSFQSFAKLTPVWASRLPVWVCKLLVISGIVPVLYWLICKLENRATVN